MNQQETARLNLTREEANLINVILRMALINNGSDLEGYHDGVLLIHQKVERAWLDKDIAELNEQYFGKDTAY